MEQNKKEVVNNEEKTRFEKFSETDKVKELLKPIQTNCPHYNLVIGLKALFTRAKNYEFTDQWIKETEGKIDEHTKKATKELQDVNKLLDDWFFDFTKATLTFCETEKAQKSDKDVEAAIIDVNEKVQSAEFHNKCVELAKKIRQWVNVTQVGMNHEVIFETISLFA